MDPAAALHRLGGVPGHARLVELTTPARLRGAAERGEVTRLARDRYALPDVDRALSAATRLSGALALRSAALHHEWAVKWVPPVSEIAVAHTRHSPSSRGARLVWNADHDPRRLMTGPLDTVIMSARGLPFDEALCIADSALREGAVTEVQLRRAAEDVRGAGAAKVRRVAAEADRRAADPFESVLRAICLDAGFRMTPQHSVDVGERLIHPDLVDPSSRLVLEADSWEWHTGRQAHDDDCWRYVAHSWVVFRFTWTQVMFGVDYVRTILGHARHAEVARIAPVVA